MGKHLACQPLYLR